MPIEQNIIAAVAEVLEKQTTSSNELFFPEEGFSAEVFQTERFHAITINKSPKSIVFVDGGNASLLAAPQLTLDIIRIGGIRKQQDKYPTTTILDFSLLTTAQQRSREIFFTPQLFFDAEAEEKNNALVEQLRCLGKDLAFSTKDASFCMGKKHASIAAMSSLVRRCSELVVARDVLTQLSAGDLVVLDGSFSCQFSVEEKLLQQLLSDAQQQGIFIVALSKTSEVLTTAGAGFSSFLQQQCLFPVWLYTPAGTFSVGSSKAVVSYVKLHGRSKHVFRLDCLQQHVEDLKKITAALAVDATDPVFYGYPYGLMKVDLAARVSNEEKEYLLTKFFVLAGKHGEQLRQLMTATNAHSILDSVR